MRLSRFSQLRWHSTKRSFYEVLKIQTSATQEEIKVAYYTQSKVYHPDVCTEHGATEKFAEIAEAYQVLSDPATKIPYDRDMFPGSVRPEVRTPPRMRNAKREGPLDYQNAQYNFDTFYRQHYREAIKRDIARKKQQQQERRQEEEDDKSTFWIFAALIAGTAWFYQ